MFRRYKCLNIIFVNNMNYKFKHSVVGGTFDRFHKGHESLLIKSFSKSKRVTIGICSDKFAHERFKNGVEDYETRFKSVTEFLTRNNLIEKVKIIKIEDVFGTTLTDETIDSIVVSHETINGARRINSERLIRGLAKLQVQVVPLVLDQKRRVISSTNVREGLTSRLGEDYFSRIRNIKYILPDEIRPSISKPQGKIISEKDLMLFDLSKYPRIILVGDIVTKTFIKYGYKFDLSIVDLKSRKRKLFKSLSDLGIENETGLDNVKNRRGTISRSLIKAIRRVLIKNSVGSVIKVIGEEDLAVIPAVILAPLSSLIFYGQRNEGIVRVEVTEKAKGKFIKILGYFKKG